MSVGEANADGGGHPNDDAPAQGGARASRRLIAYGVAATVIVLAGIAAVVLLRDDPTTAETSANGVNIIPPTEATDISGVQVPGGSTINFSAGGQQWQLTQLGNDGSYRSDDQMETMWAATGAEAVDINGLGRVYVLCANGPGTTAPRQPRDATTAAVWLDDSLFLNLLARGDGAGATCGSGSLAASPLVAMVQSLRQANAVEWQNYVSTHDVQDLSETTTSKKSCISSGPSEVCAERDGGVQLTVTGLEPGSTFAYEVQIAGRPDTMTNELVVSAEGRLPGAISILSPLPMPVTINVSATASDGRPMSGPLLVR